MLVHFYICKCKWHITDCVSHSSFIGSLLWWNMCLNQIQWQNVIHIAAHYYKGLDDDDSPLNDTQETVKKYLV